MCGWSVWLILDYLVSRPCAGGVAKTVGGSDIGLAPVFIPGGEDKPDPEIRGTRLAF